MKTALIFAAAAFLAGCSEAPQSNETEIQAQEQAQLRQKLLEQHRSDLEKRSKFLVRDVELVGETDTGLMATQRMRASLTNNLDHAVANFSGRFKVVSPGRSVPWKELNFIIISIPGGVEPGETIEYEFTATSLDGWDEKIALPEDIYFDVEVTGLRGPEGT